MIQTFERCASLLWDARRKKCRDGCGTDCRSVRSTGDCADGQTVHPTFDTYLVETDAGSNSGKVAACPPRPKTNSAQLALKTQRASCSRFVLLTVHCFARCADSLECSGLAELSFSMSVGRALPAGMKMKAATGCRTPQQEGGQGPR